MERSYGVVWREGARTPVTGKLELLPRAMRLEGLNDEQEIPYEAVAAIRVGRSASDRINGGPSVVVERRRGDPITIATVAQPSVVGEIAERLAALRLGAQESRRVVVIVPFKPGAHESVSRLLKQGPPFDPAAIKGLDRHEVFLTSEEVVFVFESELGADALAPLLAEPKLWEAAAAWGEHVAGPPRIAESAFSWSRGEPDEDISFLPTPGPGDSDGDGGHEVFAGLGARRPGRSSRRAAIAPFGGSAALASRSTPTPTPQEAQARSQTAARTLWPLS